MKGSLFKLEYYQFELIFRENDASKGDKNFFWDIFFQPIVFRSYEWWVGEEPNALYLTLTCIDYTSAHNEL